LEPGDDRDDAVEEADELGTRGSAEFHPLFGLVQEAVDGAGAVFLSLPVTVSGMEYFSLSLMRSRFCLRKGAKSFP
jgi:hypothetical protein